MKAIILVAGIGTRLKPLTDNIPKCLTEVNGISILENMLEQLNNCSISEIILVVGYLKDKIKEKIGNKFKDIKIKYVENNIYDKTNTSYSLWIALKDLEINDKLLVLEGDIFFEKELLNNFLKDDFLTSTIVQKYNPNLDGSFVELNSNLVVDWIHKKVRSVDFIIENKFKTVNIHKFDSSFIKNILKPILEQHIKENNGKEPIEYVMQDIVKNKKGLIHAFETGSLKWFEIDNLEELKIAEEIFK